MRLAQDVGLDRVRETAQRFGLPVTSNPAFLLGAAETSPLSLVTAYAMLANGGERVVPRGVLMALDRNGRVIAEAASAESERIAGQFTIEQLTQMLNAAAHNSLSQSAADAAGKSGTSSEARDAWFVGFSGDVTAAIWMGNDDGRPMRGVAGGTLPAQIWLELMANAEGGSGRVQ